MLFRKKNKASEAIFLLSKDIKAEKKEMLRLQKQAENLKNQINNTTKQEDKIMEKYKLINYFDVWGNAEEGWEVNNLCTEMEDITITNDATDKEILEYLVSIGFLTTSDMRKVRLENSCSPDMIEIYQVKGMMPLGRLEKMIAQWKIFDKFYLPDECWIVTSRNTSGKFYQLPSSACVVGNYMVKGKIFGKSLDILQYICYTSIRLREKQKWY